MQQYKYILHVRTLYILPITSLRYRGEVIQTSLYYLGKERTIRRGTEISTINSSAKMRHLTKTKLFYDLKVTAVAFSPQSLTSKL